MEKSYNKRLVFWGACAGMLLFGICIVTLGSVTLHLKQKFNFTDLEIGSLFAISPLGIIAGSLIFGPIVDKNGYKWLLFASALCLALGFYAIGNTDSLLLLRLSIFLFGLGGGAINGATNALVSLISEENKMANLSMLSVFYGVGGLGMPLVLSSLSKIATTEQLVSIVSVLALSIAFILLLLRYPPPLRETPVSFSQALSIFKRRVPLLITAFLFLELSLEAVANNWTTRYLTGHLQFVEERALLALSTMVIGITIMRIIIGTIWRNASDKALLITALSLLLGGSLTLYFSLTSLIFPALFLFGMGLAIGFPLMLAIIGSLYKEMAGTAFSIVLVIGFLGNFSVNYLMGYVADSYGIATFSSILLGIVACMTLVSLLIFKYKGRTEGV